MGEVLEKGSFLKKFKILSGEPLFKKGYRPEADAFHHEAYANTIYELLLNNKPPLTIGLFGSWGIGKSTVINILLDKIKTGQSQDLIPVYFNAWKYLGDSFRRQFLLAVAEQMLLNKEREAEVDHIKNLFHKEILKEVKKPIIESLKERFTHFKKEPLRFLRLALSSIVIAFLVFALIEFRIPAPIIAIITGFLLYLLTKTIPDIFQVNIPFETDPQLVLPEQFEQKFKDILDTRKHKDNNILIIIDDFDRCHPQMIYDILTSVKTFLKHNRCFFLIALDDKSVVEILSKENPRYKSYEELRKYFDATVRMCPIGESDLVDFANAIARETGIPENIIQIAILAEYNDARKMKHFINTFVVKYRIAKEREAAGFIPFDIDDQLDALAKMVVIETQYPQVFDQIVKEPQFLEKLEKQALGSNPGNKDVDKCFKSYPDLKKFLENTRNVRIDMDLFSTLKTSNIEVELPEGVELKHAILYNRKDTIKEILREIKADKKETILVDLVVDMLNRATAIFLQNTVTFVLEIINLEGFLTDSGKSRLAAQAVCKNFFKPSEKRSIFTQNINYFFKCANIAGSDWLKELAQNSIEEINKEENIPDHVDETINNLHNYQLLIGQVTWINTINKKLDEWHDKALKEHKELEYLQAIDKLYIPEKKEIENGQPTVPSIETLEKIVKSISTNSDETTIKLNELKRKILFGRWNDALVEIVSERTQAIFAQYPNEATFSQPIRFAIETIVDMPVWLDKKNATQIAASVQNFYGRCSERKGKMESLKAILKAASTIPEPTAKNNSINFFLEQSTQFNESEIKEFDEFITQYKDNKIWQEIKKKFVLHQWGVVKSQKNAPNEMIKQRFIYCHKNKEFVEVSEISDFLTSSLDVESEDALSFWKDIVIDYAKKIDAELPKQIIVKCMKTIKATQTTDSRRRINCEILLELLSQISKNKRTTFVEEFIALLNNPDPPIRNCAVSFLPKIEELSLKRDFKIAINNVTRDICDKAPSEILDCKTSLDAALGYPNLWGSAEWKDLAGLIKRMLDLNLPENIRKYARELIRKLPKVPKEYAGDLTHQLITLSRSSSIDEEKQDCERIMSEMKNKGLEEKEIDKYFEEKSKKEEKK